MATATAEQRGQQTGRNGHSYQQYRSDQQREDRERIRGPWVQGDDSDNRLEVAETDDSQLLALRDSYHHGRMIFATRRQIREFADAVQNDPRVRDVVRAG